MLYGWTVEEICEVTTQSAEKVSLKGLQVTRTGNVTRRLSTARLLRLITDVTCRSARELRTQQRETNVYRAEW